MKLSILHGFLEPCTCYIVGVIKVRNRKEWDEDDESWIGEEWGEWGYIRDVDVEGWV